MAIIKGSDIAKMKEARDLIAKSKAEYVPEPLTAERIGKLMGKSSEPEPEAKKAGRPKAEKSPE